ncbi:hypothetical protein PF003_g19213 [Phytophthora fragariae]|nr:hypothetical protein PF003_g19213 [Phytophthora fragariae]
MLAAGYDESKLHLTETGWPYEGDDYEGNSPSYDGMQQYLDDWATWSSSVQSSYWFMMYDTTVIYTGANYETHFGVFGDDMVAHVTIPGGSSSSTGTTSSTTRAPDYGIDIYHEHLHSINNVIASLLSTNK